MGFLVFAFNARFGSLPLPPGALAVFEAARCLVGLGFEVLCLGLGALGMGLVGAFWMRSGCWLARDRACARRKAQGFKAFALCAMGFLVFAFNARFGSLPLPMWLWLCLRR